MYKLFYTLNIVHLDELSLMTVYTVYTISNNQHTIIIITQIYRKSEYLGSKNIFYQKMNPKNS